MEIRSQILEGKTKMTRRRTKRQRKAQINRWAFALLILCFLLLIHAWVFFTVGGLALAAIPAYRIYRIRTRPPVKGKVTSHTEMSPADLAATRARQKSRVIALGPNATESDRKAFRRDNPTVKPNDSGDKPPF